MLNLEKIGCKILTRRKELNLTQNELAESLFVTHQAVSKWEKGRSIPTIDLLYELTKILDISIDYLLDDTDIKDDDYDSLFRNLPREAVIKRFLDSPDLNTEVDKIFYLLTKQERTYILELLVGGKISLQMQDFWHLLSSTERQYMLNVIVNGKYDYDLNSLSSSLSYAEQKQIENAYKDGKYNYFIRKYRGVIMDESN